MKIDFLLNLNWGCWRTNEAQTVIRSVPSWTGSVGKCSRFQEILLCSVLVLVGHVGRLTWCFSLWFFLFCFFQGSLGTGVKTWSQIIIKIKIWFYFSFFWFHTEKGGQSASDVTNTTVCVCVRANVHNHTHTLTHTFSDRRTQTHTWFIGLSEVWEC